MTETKSAAVVESVQDLTPAANSTSQKITSDDIVLCRNRGRKTIEQTFDATHYQIAPGLFKVRYDAAKHFQGRAIVPGTRNLATNGYVSFIGIIKTADQRALLIDSEEMCAPFTDEQLRIMGEKVEAIDREGSGAAVVQPVPIGTVLASTLRSTGPGARPSVDLSQQASPEAAEAADHVLDPVGHDNLATTQAEAEAEADGHRPAPTRRGKR